MIGSRRYPCGCTYTRVAHEPGRYRRRCGVCRTRWTLIVSVARHATPLCGTPVLRIDWEPA